MRPAPAALAFALAGASVGCSSGPAPIDPAAPIDLSESLAPLRERFEAGPGRVRVIAALSPTTPSSIGIARQLREDVLASLPEGWVDVSVVWVHVQPSDDADAAYMASSAFAGYEVATFFDPFWRSGGPLAHLAGWRTRGARAWNACFVFAPDATWPKGGVPSAPYAHVHQLPELIELDGATFKSGAALALALRQACERALDRTPAAAVAPAGSN